MNFENAPRYIWRMDGKNIGYFTTYDSLSFLIVNEASHMVPFNKPRESFIMFNNFIYNEKFEVIRQYVKSNAKFLELAKLF
jgi:carboxypeptidase C (cathepsin A)